MEKNIVDHDRCTLCELCIDDCVRLNLWISEDMVKVGADNCNQCGHCKAVCPEDAIEIPGLNKEEFEPMPGKDGIPSADDLLTFFRSRRSTRIYRKQAVEKEDLEKIIEAGRFAPTGGNRQSLQYTVGRTPEMMDSIRDTAMDVLAEQGRIMEQSLKEKEERGEEFTPTDEAMKRYAQSWQFMSRMHKEGTDRLFYHAPALVVCHADPEESPNPDVDAGLAAMQMGLMAETLGLGTCYIGFLVLAGEISPELKNLLLIPKHHKIPFTFVTGYPDITYHKLVARNPARVKFL